MNSLNFGVSPIKRSQIKIPPKTKSHRRPRYFNDPQDGSPLVSVPLVGVQTERGEALIDRADFDRLVNELAVSMNWTFNGGSVRAATRGASGCLIGIARAIVGAGAGQFVKHRNRDRTDLRRKNLKVREGGQATRNDLRLIQERAARLQRKAAINKPNQSLLAA